MAMSCIVTRYSCFSFIRVCFSNRFFTRSQYTKYGFGVKKTVSSSDFPISFSPMPIFSGGLFGADRKAKVSYEIMAVFYVHRKIWLFFFYPGLLF
jgi:hypothetical protein